MVGAEKPLVQTANLSQAVSAAVRARKFRIALSTNVSERISVMFPRVAKRCIRSIPSETDDAVRKSSGFNF